MKDLRSAPLSAVNRNVYLRVGDVTKLLSIHANTLRRWSDLGAIKTIRLGPRGDRRYKLEDIVSFLSAEQSGNDLNK